MSPSIWQLLIVLAIVLVLFGAKRLRNLGGDLGTAVKGFKSAMREGEAETSGEQGGDSGGRLTGSTDDEGADTRFEDERKEDAGERK